MCVRRRGGRARGICTCARACRQGVALVHAHVYVRVCARMHMYCMCVRGGWRGGGMEGVRVRVWSGVV